MSGLGLEGGLTALSLRRDPTNLSVQRERTGTSLGGQREWTSASLMQSQREKSNWSERTGRQSGREQTVLTTQTEVTYLSKTSGAPEKVLTFGLACHYTSTRRPRSLQNTHCSTQIIFDVVMLYGLCCRCQFHLFNFIIFHTSVSDEFVVWFNTPIA